MTLAESLGKPSIARATPVNNTTVVKRTSATSASRCGVLVGLTWLGLLRGRRGKAGELRMPGIGEVERGCRSPSPSPSPSSSSPSPPDSVPAPGDVPLVSPPSSSGTDAATTEAVAIAPHGSVRGAHLRAPPAGLRTVISHRTGLRHAAVTVFATSSTTRRLPPPAPGQSMVSDVVVKHPVLAIPPNAAATAAWKKPVSPLALDRRQATDRCAQRAYATWPATARSAPTPLEHQQWPTRYRNRTGQISSQRHGDLHYQKHLSCVT